jgi:hypothetical protein
MVEVARDWNYANTGICSESAFILRARGARRFLRAQLPLLRHCTLLSSLRRTQAVRCARARREKTA